PPPPPPPPRPPPPPPAPPATPDPVTGVCFPKTRRAPPARTGKRGRPPTITESTASYDITGGIEK
ncbi:MAG: hypothetical protein LUG50_03925, partial [Planctomycetaceae bacterium]|nr:hypothetical protein [Planctomycetaceae bacterium]